MTRDTMILCIVDGIKLFERLLTSEMFSSYIFMNEFSYFVDNNFDKL